MCKEPSPPAAHQTTTELSPAKTTNAASTLPSANSLAPDVPRSGRSAVATSAPLANRDTSTWAAKSGAVATTIAMAAMAESPAPIAVSIQPCGRSARVKPLSTTALCWKKVIHGVTVAPISARMRHERRAEAARQRPPTCDRMAKGGAARFCMEGRRNEQQIEDGQAHQRPFPSRIAPQGERCDHQYAADHNRQSGRQAEIQPACLDGNEFGDQDRDWARARRWHDTAQSGILRHGGLPKWSMCRSSLNLRAASHGLLHHADAKNVPRSSRQSGRSISNMASGRISK